MRSSCGDTLVVVRILRNGRLACSKPCTRCVKFAQSYGIRKIVYVAWDESIKEMKI